jgi:hypothetical protein
VYIGPANQGGILGCFKPDPVFPIPMSNSPRAPAQEDSEGQAAIGMDDRLDQLPGLELPTNFRHPENTLVLFATLKCDAAPGRRFASVRSKNSAKRKNLHDRSTSIQAELLP